MNVLFFTVELFEGAERLMPWRTLFEVATEMEKKGHKAIVVSSFLERDEFEEKFKFREFKGIEIFFIKKINSELSNIISHKAIDVLFYPFSWRDGLTTCLGFNHSRFRLDFLKNIECKKIAYFTGGVYSLRGCFFLGLSTSLMSVLPYFFDCIVPKSLILNKLKSLGFSSVVTFSDYTKSKCVSCGWSENKVFTILPGLDNFGNIYSDSSCFDKYNLVGRKYFLFIGAPAPIRGGEWLMNTFDEFCDLSGSEEMFLVMLIRTDVKSDFESFHKVYSKLKNKKNILIIRDIINPCQLKFFIEHAWAVIFPFLLIPSEIPLSFFEVLSCGSPIIAFDNGGSTRYLKDVIISVKVGAKKRFLSVLEDVWRDEDLHSFLKTRSKAFMDLHPTWSEVGKSWMSLIG